MAEVNMGPGDDSPGASITVAIPTYTDTLSVNIDEEPKTTHIHGLDGASDRIHVGPRRGSFPVDEDPAMPKTVVVPQFPNLRRNIDASPNTASTMTKHDLQPTLSASLAPKSGILSSQTVSQYEELTDSDEDFRYSVPLSSKSRSTGQSTPSAPVHPTTLSTSSTMKPLSPDEQVAIPRREPKTSSRRVKSYTLDDGTIVSGKGLGRGRPGIKRGPRNVKYKLEEAKTMVDFSTIPLATDQPPASTVPSQSNKRKRAVSGTSVDLSVTSSLTSPSRDSSPEYNPTGATRSGRLTQKPPPLVVLAPESASPVTKRPKVQSTNSTPNVVKTHPKIKRRNYRGRDREQLALCEHCLRGHGPVGNVIVFCDACNKCWHQRCHDPQISPSTVADSKADWFCADCDRILHGKKHRKDKAQAAKAAMLPTADAAATFHGPLVEGAILSQVEKVTYLQSLSKDRLINLVLQASNLAPALPMFQVAKPVLPAAKFTSSYTTPTSATPVFHTAAGAAEAEGDEDEGYETYVDEHALLYPKPGHGIKLPPERDDMHMLLEGKEIKTFSHWVRGRNMGDEYSGTGDVGGKVEKDSNEVLGPDHPIFGRFFARD